MCFLILCTDQEKADLKASDTGEVGEGQETARAKEVWQKGWCLFCSYWTSLTLYLVHWKDAADTE